MIERKKKICKNCNTPQFLWSKGRCKSCASLEDNSPIKKVGENKKNDYLKSNELYPYFSYHISQIEKSPYCVNCGCRIQASHFHVAHVIPKSKFPSVRSNLHNAVYLCASILGGNGCHDDFDKNCNDIEWLTTFKALPKILEAFSKFKLFVEETEKKEYRVLEYIYGQKNKKDEINESL